MVQASARKLFTNKRWKKQHPVRVKDLTLRWQYGISLKEHRALKKLQKNRCKICGRRPNKSAPVKQARVLHLDHDHKVGRVRGFLCFHCNRGLGSFFDSADLCRSAALYLEGML